jgi:hypothetical protein
VSENPIMRVFNEDNPCPKCGHYAKNYTYSAETDLFTVHCLFCKADRHELPMDARRRDGMRWRTVFAFIVGVVLALCAIEWIASWLAFQSVYVWPFV